MVVGFAIWSIVSFILLGIGIRARKSDRAAGFYTGVRPPEVNDVRRYNRAISVLWFAYAIVFELLGLPFLFQRQNSAGFLWSVFGVAVITIALMIIYNRILAKHTTKRTDESCRSPKNEK